MIDRRPTSLKRRPMVGLFSSLSDKQQRFVLDYQGPVNHGAALPVLKAAAERLGWKEERS